MPKRSLAPLLLLLLGLLAACGTRGQATAPADPSGISVEGGSAVVGEPAPRFTFTTTAGETLSSESLAGQIVILNFWATWCAPCRIEMPEFEDVYQRHRDDGLTIVAVEIESSAGGEASEGFLKEVGVTFPTVRDAKGLLEDAFMKLPAYPTTVFINREGIVHFVQVGPVTAELLDEMIAQMAQ